MSLKLIDSCYQTAVSLLRPCGPTEPNRFFGPDRVEKIKPNRTEPTSFIDQTEPNKTEPINSCLYFLFSCKRQQGCLVLNYKI